MQTSVYIKPTEALRSIVKNILLVEYQATGNILQPSSFYADGYPGFIFQKTENDCLLYKRVKKLPSLFLYGQTVEPVELLPSGSYRMIIFFLYPHVLKSLFKIQPKELRDNCLDITLLPISGTENLKEMLHTEGEPDKQVNTMTRYLLEIVKTNEIEEENMINYAVAHIANNSKQVSLKELRTYLNVTERTFERRFEHYVGISPKLFLRICQFQSSLQQISKSAFGRLSDIAYDNGYADQAHFIRVFKEFTGLTPLEYYKLICSNDKIGQQT